MNVIFSTKLKELRLEQKLSQLQLAKLLNYTQSNICEWENGKVEPRADALITISSFFNVSIDYLLGQSEEPNAIVLRNYDLKTREQQLIENYRKLPSQTQDYVFGIVQNLALNS